MGWVTQFFANCNKNPGQAFDANEALGFLEDLGRRHEDWQVNQAQKAIELYRFFQSRKVSYKAKDNSTIASDAWKIAADDMVKRLRLKQRILTEPNKHI